jgi:TRAP-type transport system periplasmic protein
MIRRLPRRNDAKSWKFPVKFPVLREFTVPGSARRRRNDKVHEDARKPSPPIGRVDDDLDHGRRRGAGGGARGRMTVPSNTIRFAGYQGEASVHTRAIRSFAGAVEARLGTPWRVDVTANVTDHGHKAADLPAMVADGRLDLCYFNSSYLAERVPSLALFDIPFALAGRAHIYRQLDGDVGARLGAGVAAATPYRVLKFWDNGFRHISNRLRPIRSPDDCAGLRLRTVASALHQEIFAALGFTPVVIDVKDLVAAVTSHAVDAQENPLTNLVNFNLHRTHRHVSLTSHFFGVVLVLANRAWFDGLDPAVRTALHDALGEATARQREFAIAEDTQCLEVLRQDGVDVAAADAIDIAGFRARLAAIVARETARLDPALRATFGVE